MQYVYIHVMSIHIAGLHYTYGEYTVTLYGFDDRLDTKPFKVYVASVG